MNSRPTARLAPSPTGHLHVGHARSFLLAWLTARSRGGRVLLRMEDLDRSRVRSGMTETCLQDLEWLGLDWDGPILLQSDGQEQLMASAYQLERAGLAYACTCTRREIELARSAPHSGEESDSIYPGTCLGRYESLEAARRLSGREPALRLRVPSGSSITVEDTLLGTLTQDVSSTVGDFPLSSRDGQVAYQLAVVVDDARQGVTQVLRGDDLWSSTPRQALLQEHLGLPRPEWIHVPLVTDDGGRRLAKRHDDLSLRGLREEGVSAERLVGWLARSVGQTVKGPIRPAELLPDFDLGRLPGAPVAFGEAALKELREAAPGP
jgi:glutamyl-tRNA synthetase